MNDFNNELKQEKGNRLDMKVKIHSLLERGYNQKQIAEELGIHRNTVKNYLTTSTEKLLENKRKTVKKKQMYDKLEPYIIKGLKQHVNIGYSALITKVERMISEEIEGDYRIEVSYNTFKSYTKQIRMKTGLLKEEKKEAQNFTKQVHDKPGEWCQVDFGQKKMYKKSGGAIKVYFIAFVLSYSRMIYCYFLSRPFLSKDVVEAHQKAMIYFGGMPKTFMYDQDKLMLIKEYFGNFYETELFKQFRKDFKFEAYYCTKATPTTKGMIEKTVDFVKANFLESYQQEYTSNDKLNEHAMDWLKKKNGRIHAETFKKPVEMFDFEKNHLLQVQDKIDKSISINIIARSVIKNNTFRFDNNIYSLPPQTFNKGIKHIRIVIKEYEIDVYEIDSYEYICSHKIAIDVKGTFVIIPEHVTEDKRILRQEQAVSDFIDLFPREFAAQALNYCSQIIFKYGYSRREIIQIKKANELLSGLNKTIRIDVLNKATQYDIYDAEDLTEIITNLFKRKEEVDQISYEQLKIEDVDISEHLNIEVEKSNIDEKLAIFKENRRNQ